MKKYRRLEIMSCALSGNIYQFGISLGGEAVTATAKWSDGNHRFQLIECSAHWDAVSEHLVTLPPPAEVSEVLKFKWRRRGDRAETGYGDFASYYGDKCSGSRTLFERGQMLNGENSQTVWADILRSVDAHKWQLA